MKKRILSLILAFAMAATLAPATALVGSDTAKAADVTSATSTSPTDETNVVKRNATTLYMKKGAQSKVFTLAPTSGDTGNWIARVNSSDSSVVSFGPVSGVAYNANISVPIVANKAGAVNVTYEAKVGADISAGTSVTVTPDVNKVVVEDTPVLSVTPSASQASLGGETKDGKSAANAYELVEGIEYTFFVEDTTKNEEKVNFKVTSSSTGTTLGGDASDAAGEDVNKGRKATFTIELGSGASSATVSITAKTNVLELENATGDGTKTFYFKKVSRYDANATAAGSVSINNVDGTPYLRGDSDDTPDSDDIVFNRLDVDEQALEIKAANGVSDLTIDSVKLFSYKLTTTGTSTGAGTVGRTNIAKTASTPGYGLVTFKNIRSIAKPGRYTYEAAVKIGSATTATKIYFDVYVQDYVITINSNGGTLIPVDSNAGNQGANIANYSPTAKQGIYTYLDAKTLGGGKYQVDLTKIANDFERNGYDLTSITINDRNANHTASIHKDASGLYTATYKAGETYDASSDITITLNYTAGEFELPVVSNDYQYDANTSNLPNYGSYGFVNAATVAATGDAATNSSNHSIMVKIGGKLPGAYFARKGYTMKGWTDVEDGGIAKYSLNATVTEEMIAGGALYAVWEPIVYTVNFEPNVPKDTTTNVASRNMTSFKKEYGTNLTAKEAVNYLKNLYAVNNYTFAYWLAKDGTIIYPDGFKDTLDDIALGNADGAKEITLSAQWEKGSSVAIYNDTYKATSNSIFSVMSIAQADSLVPGVEAPIKSGYTFGDGVYKYTYADGSYATGNYDFNADTGVSYVYPVFSLNNYNVDYDFTDVTERTGGQDVYEVNVTLGDVAFPGVRKDFNDLVGWNLLNAANGSVIKTISTKSFNVAEVVAALEETAVFDYNDNGKTIYFVPKFMPRVKSAQMKDAAYTTVGTALSVEFGTPQAKVWELLEKEIQLLGEDGDDITSKVGIDSVSWTSKIVTGTSGYSATRAGGADYVFTGVITPKGSSARPKVTAYVKVTDQVASNVFYMTGVDSLTDIVLTNDATVADIKAAVNAILSANVTVFGDSAKKYAWPLLEIDATSVSGNAVFEDGVWTFVSGISSGTKDVEDAYRPSKAGQTIYAYQVISHDTVAANKSVPSNFYGFNASDDRLINPRAPFDASDPDCDGSDTAHTVIAQVKIIIKGEASKPSDVTEPTTTTTVEKAQSIISKGFAARMYDPNRGEHIFTRRINEVKALLAAGWNFEDGENQTFRVSSKKTDLFDTAVYRVYNANEGGAHMYTKSKGEATRLVASGWTWDDNGAPVFYVCGDSTKGKTVYRSYNPNSKSGEHMWSVRKGEHNSLINTHKWLDESTPENVWYSPAEAN